MSKKSYMVIGIGRFGEAVAMEMEHLGAEVIALDCDEDKINRIADYVTLASVVDVREENQLKNMGLSNVDGVVVAIAEDVDASVMATIIAKEAGVPYVFAKAKDAIHKRILEKVGADEVMIPEKSSGCRIARNIVNENVKDFVELSKQFQLVEILPKKEWIGKSIRQLDLRKKMQLNIVAIRDGEELSINVDPDVILDENITLLVIVDHKTMNQLTK